MTTGPVGKANTRFTMNPGTAVTPIGTATVPQSYSLAQNYPNPFNPSTIITFDVAKTQRVKLAVYDMLGKEIEVIANDVMSPGSYRATFAGASYPSGVYYYRLVTEGFSETKKMLLVK